MKLFDSFGMNPRTIRFYLLEKGIDIPRQEVDILGAENRQADYLQLNPAGQTPALELDDGRVISETYAICEYLEEKYPAPSLIGTTPEERAETRMWWRRAELNICVPMVLGFYYAEGYDLFKTRIRCLPEAADGMKQRAQDGLMWMDGLMADRPWIAGGRFTIADICLYCYVDQLEGANQKLPAEAANMIRWRDATRARAAAPASVWREQPMGMRG
ncbi:MAG: glutathione S-transferase family protein [Pseudomonadota bacterium]